MNGRNAASLKAKIRNIAKDRDVAAQVILQNYMFERFLERLSVSAYRDKFILKGGLLVAAMVGIGIRSTMDMDITLKEWPLDEEHMQTAIAEICGIPLEDGITFTFTGITPIRDDDEYGGFRVTINAVYEIINTPLSVDITAGDAITPGPVKRTFKPLFSDESKSFELWTYNTETVLAEKAETILRRAEFNTRPRDYYDVYIIAKTQDYDAAIFRQALDTTARHRGSAGQIQPVSRILSIIAESTVLRNRWKKYQNSYPYAKSITYEDIMSVLGKLLA
jgi:predicted nucleotidyltransferase component of viral defense system